MEVGHHIHQGGVYGRDFPGQCAGQLARRLAGPLPAPGVQQVGHTLRLGKVQPPVEKGPLGELPRACLAGPLGKEGLKAQGEDHGGAVAVELRCVLPSIAGRTAAVSTQHLVNDLALTVQQAAIYQRAGGMVQKALPTQGPEAGGGDIRRPRTGQPQDADGSWSGGGGHGCDGVSLFPHMCSLLWKTGGRRRRLPGFLQNKNLSILWCGKVLTGRNA